MAKSDSKKRWIVAGAVVVGALFSFLFFSGGCKKESSSERTGREAREAYEKSKELLKEGLQKGGEVAKEGLQKGGEVAKEGLEKTTEAAKGFQKGWKEGGK